MRNFETGLVQMILNAATCNDLILGAAEPRAVCTIGHVDIGDGRKHEFEGDSQEVDDGQQSQAGHVATPSDGELRDANLANQAAPHMRRSQFSTQINMQKS